MKVPAIILSLFAAAAAAAQQPFTIAAIHEIDSAILGETREIIIALPDGYEESDADYPVLYMLDAQENAEHAIGTITTLTDVGLVPPMIFVGISSINRSRDLTPSAVTGDANSGGAPAFLDFIADELMPWVEARYRANGHRILEGHSYGGLFGGYALMEEPGLFNDYIILSPSFWWNGEEMVARAATHFAQTAHPGTRVYFGIGDSDGWGMRQELRRFVEALEGANPQGISWHHEELANEEHMSVRAPAHYRALRYLFADIQMNVSAEDFEAADFRRHHADIRARYGDAVRQQEATYHNVGLALLQAERPDDAVIVFEYLVDGYPGYHANYNLLARAREAAGQCALAADAFDAAANASTTHTGTFMRTGYLEEAQRMRTLLADGSEACRDR